MKNRNLQSVIVLCAGALFLNAQNAPAPAKHVDVTVSEGTSMAVAVSPDGSTLAMDLQGSIWTLPAAGGTAKRIAPARLVARRQVDRFLRLSRWRLRYLGGCTRRHESTQAHVGALRRPRAGLFARRHAARFRIRPRQSIGQQLQHLDA
jgi:hypothetical protein